jgi:dephospho-CoA kinase
MKIIGITGGIGSGKSTVAAMLEKKGAVVVNADKIGHEMLLDAVVRRELAQAFGQDVLDANGEVDRTRLSGKVFGKPEAVARLNAITHPRITLRAKADIAACRKRGEKLVVLDAPLLVEAGWTGLVDEVWVTEAPPEIIMQRVCERSGLDVEEIAARINAQADGAERRRYADVVLDTARPLVETEKQVNSLLKENGG